MALALSAQELHLWSFFIDEYQGESDPKFQIWGGEGLLSSEETVQKNRFIFEKDRFRFLATRVLIRTLLSQYCPEVLPRDWTFKKNPYGRPEIASPVPAFPLYFNLAHSGSCILCVVSQNDHVGVDVEKIDRRVRFLEVGERFFSPDESNALQAPPKSQQRSRFFHYWTLKEAYIRARGMGLALPLDGFSFLLSSQKVKIAFHEKITDSAESWEFQLFHPLRGTSRARDYQAALAIRNEGLGPLQILEKRFAYENFH